MPVSEVQESKWEDLAVNLLMVCMICRGGVIYHMLPMGHLFQKTLNPRTLTSFACFEGSCRPPKYA